MPGERNLCRHCHSDMVDSMEYAWTGMAHKREADLLKAQIAEIEAVREEVEVVQAQRSAIEILEELKATRPDG